MKYKVFEKNGFYDGAVVDPNGIEFSPPESKQDEYGNYIYQLIDGKIILNPQQPTEEQLKAKYKQTVRAKIAEKYSIEDEIMLLFRGTEEEKEEHESFVSSVKSLSQINIYGKELVKEDPVTEPEVEG